MQMGFYFDQAQCVGCHTCTVACKDWHDIPGGPIRWRSVTTIEKGKYPQVFVTFLSNSCHHCAQPACAEACPAGAIAKREADGVVTVDTEKCLGKDACGALCKDACPYGAPQFGPENNAKMSMCNFCLDRILRNQKPVCVEACPLYALDAGPLDELQAQYGMVRDAEGFAYSAKTKPSTVFKPKRSPF